jgi:uncharacterized coiled-coil protein SlyX
MATTNIEKESLEAHVELCAERYDRMAERMENLDERLTGVEKVLKEIKSMLTEKETQAYKKLIVHRLLDQTPNWGGRRCSNWKNANSWQKSPS